MKSIAESQEQFGSGQFGSINTNNKASFINKSVSPKGIMFNQGSIGSIEVQSPQNDRGQDRSVLEIQSKLRKQGTFKMFDKLVKEKYQLLDNQFEEMPRKNRNALLKDMLETYSNMIIFPSNKLQAEDGLPHFSFVLENLKEIIKEERVIDFDSKYQRKPRVDMGIPPPKAGQEQSARAGSTFDPKQFKGNADLQKYINEI